MTVFIHGIGTATPSGKIAQGEAAKLAENFCSPTPEQARLLPVLYRRTRVQQRHSVLLAESADATAMPEFYHRAANAADRGPTTGQRMEVYQREAARLGVKACRKAIAQSGVVARDVTHLITVSCTGFCAPGFDVQIAAELQMSPEVSRTHIGFMGCHAAMNAMRVAQGYVQADPSCCVLICAVELCSLHHQYGWDPESIVANALFADGAAAMVIQGQPNTGELAGLEHIASGSMIVPETTDSMSWLIGDHGYVMTLAPTVPETILRNLQKWLTGFLRPHSLSVADVGGWLVHPGGPRILDATAEALELPDDALDESRSVLANHGNMSSPTVLFVLQKALQTHRPGPYVMLGFGPGLTIEAALFVKLNH